MARSQRYTKESLDNLMTFRLSETIRNASEALDRVGSFVVREGITISFAALIFRVSGRIYKYDDDGRETPAYAIRDALVDAMAQFRSLCLTQIPLVGITPLGWLEPILLAYEKLVGAPAPVKPGNPGFEEIPIMERLELVIMLPALLRTMLGMLGNLLERSK